MLANGNQLQRLTGISNLHQPWHLMANRKHGLSHPLHKSSRNKGMAGSRIFPLFRSHQSPSEVTLHSPRWRGSTRKRLNVRLSSLAAIWISLYLDDDDDFARSWRWCEPIVRTPQRLDPASPCLFIPPILHSLLHAFRLPIPTLYILNLAWSTLYLNKFDRFFELISVESAF